MRVSTGAILLVLIACGVTALLDPRRELLTWDDGWAYARTVVTLLRSGHYQLDQWSAANMPVQVGLAAAAARVFGYSLTLLRLTTLAALMVLLLSFRRLARDCGNPADRAFLLSLGLFASPVLLMLSFTFMSDVQFLAWLVLSLNLYGRGLRQDRSWFILAGSVAAACAIGTRQFGIAILAAWAIAFLFSPPYRRPSLQTLTLALFLPMLCAAWQLWMGAGKPNFVQAYRMAEQHQFLAQPAPELAREALWRAAIWMQYVSLYMLPVAPLVLGAGLSRLRAVPSGARRRGALVTLACMVVVALSLWLGSLLTVRPAIVPGPLWPALGIMWMISTQSWATPEVQTTLDLVAYVLIAPLVWLFASTGRLMPERRPEPATLLVVGCGITLFAMMFAYVQLNDTYVVMLLPFTLLALGAAIREAPPGSVWKAATLVWSLVMLFTVTDLTRRSYDEQQIAWDAAERAAATGKPFDKIAGPKQWAEYHGAFDDWIAAGAPGLNPPTGRPDFGQDPFHDHFYAWLHWRNEQNRAQK